MCLSLKRIVGKLTLACSESCMSRHVLIYLNISHRNIFEEDTNGLIDKRA